jgi:streptogramin lyase
MKELESIKNEGTGPEYPLGVFRGPEGTSWIRDEHGGVVRIDPPMPKRQTGEESQRDRGIYH